MKELHKELLKRAELANQASVVARDVACKAEEVARKVVEEARITAEKVLLFSQTMEYIQKDIAEIKTKLDNKYVTKEEFSSVKAISYSLVGIICVSVVGAILNLVFNR